uniref:Uncharacterized protein n=1 Tax=Anopheles coluzzii TaxID=1518534 RepID=A0A8W7PSZ2_ANOCL
MRFSNRRRIAESSIQGVLVAPSTSTPSLSLPTPCICTRNSVLMRRALSLSLSDRAEQSESTSSMKTIDGLWARASSNRFLTSFSDSPSHFETRSELDTEKKVELLASVATAFANIPFHGIRLPVNRCGNLIGSMTASLSAVLAPSSPATSDHLTCGFSTTIAPSSFACSFFFSGSSESESELSFPFDLSSFAAPSPSFTGFFLPFFRLMQMVVLVYGDYASGIVVPFFGGRVARRSSGKRT